VGQQVAMLVNRAALDRQILAPQRYQCRLKPWCSVNDHELGPFQPALIEIIEKLSLRCRALAAHIHDGKQYLVLSRMWWKFSGGDLGALGFGPDQATRSRAIGSMG
jgi:hypothetical protein